VNLFFLVIILMHFRDALIRAASQKFTLLILFGLLWLSGTSVLYAIVPSNGSNMLCYGRLWCSCISLMIILSVLVAKSFRVSVIFGSKVLMQIKTVTDSYVATLVALFTLVEVIMLVIFNSLQMTWAALVSNGSNTVVWACDTGNGFNVWMGVQIGIFAVVMVAGAVVAFRTRSVPSAFNESTHILFSLQILIFMMLILVPIDWALINNSPEAAVVIQGGGQALLASTLGVSNFAPKLFFIFTGRANDKSLVFNSGTQSSSNGGSSFSGRGSSGSKGAPVTSLSEGSELVVTNKTAI